MRRNTAALIQIIRGCKIDIVHAPRRAPCLECLVGVACHAPALRDTFTTVRTDLPLKRWYNSVMARGERSSRSRISSRACRQVYGIGRDRLRIIPRGVTSPRSTLTE